MKLNGALKPHQGASKQGRSPGVVFKEYRVKRYFKANKNVVNGLPLNAPGARNKKSIYDNNVLNSNYNNSISNQQRAITSHSHQLERKVKCGGEALIRGICKSLSRITSYTLKRIIKQTDLSTHDNSRPFSVAAARETEACRYLNNRARNYNFLQNVSKAEEEAGANIQIHSEPLAVINIAARQIGNIKLKLERAESRESYIAETEVNSDHFERKVHSPSKKDKNFLGAKNTNDNLNVITWRLAIELKLMLFSIYLHAMRQSTHSAAGHNKKTANIDSKANRNRSVDFRRLRGYYLRKMMRAPQIIVSFFRSICLINAKGFDSPVALLMVIYAATAILLPQTVAGDDGDTFFPINGIETTTPEFDYASRGQKKFGDKCENTLECGFPGSICDPKKKSCQCTEDLPVTNHIDKCGKESAVNESCFFNEQCEVKYFQTECRDQRCVCRFDMTPIWLKDGSVECKGRGDKKGPETYIDPAMIGVLIGMALMFIIICVVLRLFSQARWRENRTIFNTPNPRLMNVSLLRESKLLHGQERRGSRMSVRAPSRQPSMASLRPHSPNPSLGRMTRSKSNTRSSESRVSDASNCSRLLEHHAAANAHHGPHSHANAISPHSSSTNHGAQTSVSPISLNDPTTIITNVNEAAVAETTTDSTTNLPTTKTDKNTKY